MKIPTESRKYTNQSTIVTRVKELIDTYIKGWTKNITKENSAILVAENDHVIKGPV
jgi:hypothetical protein